MGPLVVTRSKDVAASCGLALLGFIVYSNTLSAGFVYDDSRAIVANQDLRPEKSLHQLFANDYWGTPLKHSGSHKSYRPLTVLTFRLNYFVGGLQPFGYHLVNVLLHCANTVLVYALSSRLLRSFVARLLSAVVFALHPVHVEAVAGLVGRAELLAGVCVLTALLLVLRDDAVENSRRRLCMVTTLTFAATFCKEQGLLIPPLVVAARLLLVPSRPAQLRRTLTLGILRARNTTESALRRELLSLVGLFVTLVLFRLWLMDFAKPEFHAADNPAAHSPSFFTRCRTFLYLPVFNLLLIVFPRTLSFDWSMDAIPLVECWFDPRFLLSLFTYSLAVFASAKLLRRALATDDLVRSDPSRSPSPKFDLNSNRIAVDNNNSFVNSCNVPQCAESMLFAAEKKPTRVERSCSDDCQSRRTLFAAGFMVLTFLPATNLLTYVGFVVAERVLYLPSIGYCMLLGVGIEQLLSGFGKLRGFGRISLSLLAVVAAASLFGRTWVRNWDWKNEETLYRSGLETNPAKAYSNLGNVLSKDGRNGDAEMAYRTALRFRPNMADTHYNLGTLLQGQSRFLEAVECHRRAIFHRSRLATAYLNLGMALWSLERHDEAEETFLTGAGQSDDGLKDPRAHRHARTSCLYNLGRLLVDRGRVTEAVAAYTRAVTLLQTDGDDYASAASLYNMLGEAHLRTDGATAEATAERWYRRALGVRPRHMPAHLTMGHLRLRQKRVGDAKRWFRSAVDLAPTDANALFHLGQFHERTGDLVGAVTFFRRALRQQPVHYESTVALATALRLSGGDEEEMERLYRSAVQLRPDCADARVNLGAMLHLKGEWSQAKLEYLEALRLRPGDRTTVENLRKVQRKLDAFKRIPIIK